jgi:hypothetical protein
MTTSITFAVIYYIHFIKYHFFLLIKVKIYKLSNIFNFKKYTIELPYIIGELHNDKIFFSITCHGNRHIQHRL